MLFGGEWVQFARAPLYGFIALVAAALALQVRYLNKGLENADAMRVVPVFQAAIVFSNSMGGIIFYGDLLDESAGHQAAFAFGALVSICGVAVLLCKGEGGGGGGSGGGHQVLQEEGGSESGSGSGSGSGAAGGGGAPGGAAAPGASPPQTPHSPLLSAAVPPSPGPGLSSLGGERRGYQPVKEPV